LKKNAKNTGYICKIGDFGLAREIGDEETAITNCGTESYMAPEILSCHRYDKQADIWSLGVLLYYLLFGEFPFKGIAFLNQVSISSTKLTLDVKLDLS
jgi:serine/threonine protein kinase